MYGFAFQPHRILNACLYEHEHEREHNFFPSIVAFGLPLSNGFTYMKFCWLMYICASQRAQKPKALETYKIWTNSVKANASATVSYSKYVHEYETAKWPNKSIQCDTTNTVWEALQIK